MKSSALQDCSHHLFMRAKGQDNLRAKITIHVNLPEQTNLNCSSRSFWLFLYRCTSMLLAHLFQDSTITGFRASQLFRYRQLIWRQELVVFSSSQKRDSLPQFDFTPKWSGALSLNWEAFGRGHSYRRANNKTALASLRSASCLSCLFTWLGEQRACLLRSCSDFSMAGGHICLCFEAIIRLGCERATLLSRMLLPILHRCSLARAQIKTPISHSDATRLKHRQSGNCWQAPFWRLIEAATSSRDRQTALQMSNADCNDQRWKECGFSFCKV